MVLLGFVLLIKRALMGVLLPPTHVRGDEALMSTCSIPMTLQHIEGVKDVVATARWVHHTLGVTKLLVAGESGGGTETMSHRRL